MKVADQTKPNIRRVAEAEDLAHAAHEMFVDIADKVINQNGRFNVAVSGGHTPTRFFELLGEMPDSMALDWADIQVCWVDERCVPPEAEASNYGLAAHTFLDKVPIPPDNIHRVSGEANDYAEAVREYQDNIRSLFNLKPGQIPEFDLIVLGMGDDGHIGSLVPNSYALFDTEDLVSVVYLTDGDYSRITLTHPVLCAAKNLVILVSGPEKAKILKEVLHAEPDPVKYPVHTLWPILDKVTWIVDDAAGKYL
jgi:6-phosphogluconolactonase